MRYCAGGMERAAVLGDAATALGPWVAPPEPATRRGSSVTRLRTADRAAAEDLFNASYPRLAGWVRRLVDDDETAHEIASEAFTRLLARWSGLDNPHSYLYMIATNLVRDHWRKTGRERREALPARLRSACRLHYYAGFGVREVAVMLGRPEGTIKADLHHARARLKAALGNT